MTEQQPTTLERIHQAARAEFREKGFPLPPCGASSNPWA